MPDSESPLDRASSGEQRRLEVLRRYRILETPAEERFDRITRLAAGLFDVPISLIAFLGEKRQWFKSRVGLERDSTPREIAFCRYNPSAPDVSAQERDHNDPSVDERRGATSFTSSIMVVEDAHQDPRFASNPLVTSSPHVRFYAGASLLSQRGHFLGSLCIIDRKPRTLSIEEFFPLRDLAALTMRELHWNRINRSLEKNSRLLEDRTRQVQSLSRQLTEVEEAERQHFRRLLHDDLQQLLHASRIQAENLRREGLSKEGSSEKAFSKAPGSNPTVDGNPTVDKDPDAYGNPDAEKRRESAHKLTEIIGEAIEVTRSLSTRFAPSVGRRSLRDAIEWLAIRMKQVHGLRVVVRAKGPAEVNDPTLKTLVLRLVRELLFNVVKHAETNEAVVRLSEREGRLRVAVRDDGVGFDLEKEPQFGLGLSTLRERIEIMEGTVAIDSKPNQGTRVVVEIPRIVTDRKES